MLTVKEAVDAAENWVRELYAKKELQHLRLEEVELTSDDRYWRITLSWAEPAIRENSLIAGIGRDIQRLPRVYKTLEINSETGRVKSMKIREVA